MPTSSLFARVTRSAVAALVLVTAAANSAKAQVIDFEGLSGTFVAQGYAGFDWLGGQGAFSWVNAPSVGYGSLHQPVSGVNNAWSNGGTPLVMKRTAGGSFNFGSVFMANSSQVAPFTLTGWFNNVQTFSQSVTLSTTMQQFVFNFAGVDEVQWSGNDQCCGGNLLIDDIDLGLGQSTIPEPASFALLATGLLGVFGVARRRK